MSRSIALGLAAAAAMVGCTVNAPPAEDLQGDAITVKDGRLQIDDTKVPVVDECGDGQAVVKRGEGWACVALADGTIAGAGLVVSGTTISADFGDGESQVASGARAVATEDALDLLDTAVSSLETRVSDAEAGISAITTRVDGHDTAISGIDSRVGGIDTRVGGNDTRISALDVRVTTAEADISALEGKNHSDFFVSTCNAAAIGGLRIIAGAITVCDGTAFRGLVLAEAPPPALIASYDLANVVGRTWNSTAGGAPMFLGTDMGLVNPPSPQKPGIGSQNGGGGGFASPVGHRSVTLPEQGFTIEVIMSGTDTVLSHGTDALVISFFADISIRELGRDTRYTPQNPPADTSAPKHIVFVVENDGNRSVYLNGERLTRALDSGNWTGPYLGGTDVLTLGPRGGPGGGGANATLFQRVVIHGVALNQVQVRANCQAASPAVVPICN